MLLGEGGGGISLGGGDVGNVRKNYVMGNYVAQDIWKIRGDDVRRD